MLWAPPAGGPGPGRGEPSPDDEPSDDEGLDPLQRRALDHETRRAIFELVARTPGLNTNQIARRLGIARSQAEHHLERLEAYDLVCRLDGERDNEVLCFHPAHTHLWNLEDTRLLFGQAPLRHVVLYVHDNAGTSTAAIAEALESAPRTIQEHLATLQNLGLVERHRFRRRVEYHPTDKLRVWADDVGDCYPRPWTEED